MSAGPTHDERVHLEVLAPLPHHDVAPAAGDPRADARATAAALGALGHGLLSWVQPIDLDEVLPLAAYVAELGEQEPTAGAADGPDAPVDLDAVHLHLTPDDASVDAVAPDPTHEPDAPYAVDGDDLPDGLDEPVDVLGGEPSTYSTSRDTIAMLEEMAFLDE